MDVARPYEKIGVIGAGAWGTALALTAARAGRQVSLWARESAVIDSISRTRENMFFLPGVALPTAILPTGDLAVAVQAEALLVAAPTQHLRASLTLVAAAAPKGIPLVICAKGVEQTTGKLVTEVFRETAPAFQPAILSGPSFARDSAAGLPTAVTIAARFDIAQRLQASLGHTTFRPYASDDILGVALGGAAKNVYAIACGIVDGLGLGESARAALLARGFAELLRLGAALGARSETLMGLSGLGDLVLTATSPNSRNYRFGYEVGKGRALAELCAPGGPLAEGVMTAPALIVRARREKIELPVAETVASVLDGSLPLDAAIARLMSRPLKPE
ncbi:MAG: NAD(P)-dependent glycerol-3-phosphate dehydrogenase [Alphaproteobacteria bacterium]|nr:NAD(P)-dependent glycerol-3-phosphate dehydrogenase [Alphaproteobacteria bacterium]MDE2111083.1 NAD(P)-dependent glycerol-3-phosphate dehydrogenase [Alphaproteobacteria bacterium]MDE2494783.1 NAD(P)-dependent glycerol-3-phosphate dehydrogenase [Alphaproteobacteria bacterium]